jgi:hypothetical protein
VLDALLWLFHSAIGFMKPIKRRGYVLGRTYTASKLYVIIKEYRCQLGCVINVTVHSAVIGQMAQNAFLTGQKYLQKYVVNENALSFCVRLNRAARLACHSYFAPKSLRVPEKSKPAAGNEIQARQERIKLLRQRVHCQTRNPMRGAESNCLCKNRVARHAREEESPAALSFAPEEEKSFSFHAWLQPARLNT